MWEEMHCISSRLGRLRLLLMLRWTLTRILILIRTRIRRVMMMDRPLVLCVEGSGVGTFSGHLVISF